MLVIHVMKDNITLTALNGKTVTVSAQEFR